MNFKETGRKIKQKTKEVCNDFKDYISKVSKNASYNGIKIKSLSDKNK